MVVIMIWRNLWYRKARSLLTMLGIGIGVAAIIALGAMAEGLAQGYASVVGGSGADLLVMQADAYDISLSSVDEAVGERIRQISGVQEASGAIFNIVQMDDIPYFIVGGYDPDETAINHYKIVDGQPLRHEKQILLGRQAAENLHKGVGDSISLYESLFRVVGVYETGQLFEDSGAVITLTDAQSIFKKPRQVSYYEVQLRDIDDADAVKTRIERLFDDVSVTKAADMGEQQEMVQYVRGMAWGISMIAILVGGLGMMNTMIMAVYEQTREIGVLRAVGWRRWRVLGLILQQAMLLSAAGGVLGIGFGIGLVQLINDTPAVSSFAPGVIAPRLFVQGMGVALVLGVVGGGYPAWRAAGLSPIEALRYDASAETEEEPAWLRLFGITFRNLWRRRARSLLTMGGIAVGVGFIVSLGALAEGLLREMSSFVGGGGAELVAVQQGVADMGYSVIEERVGRAIAAMPEIEDVSGTVWGVSSGEDQPMLFMIGVELKPEVLNHYYIIDGTSIRRRGEAILGKAAADTLKKRVGDVISLPGGVYRVVGVFETCTAYEDNAGVIALEDAQSAFQKPRQVSLYQIDVEDISRVDVVRRELEERFGQDISVSVAADFVENSSDFQNFQAMLGALFAMALLVGGVVVTNTMVMAVMERTREIGTLRALGWRQSRVLWLILSESLLLGLLAAGAGVLVGVGLNSLLMTIPGVGGLMAAHYSLRVFGQAVFVSLLLGLVGGAYPAWHAGRLRPVEALRYE
jgi:ABC-type antimicrobial peptide transport system permease subunit